MNELVEKLAEKNRWMVWESATGVWVHINEQNIFKFKNQDELLLSMEWLVGKNFEIKYGEKYK